MSRKNLAPSPVPEALNASTPVVSQRAPLRGVLLAIIAFVVCTFSTGTKANGGKGVDRT